MIAVAKVPMSSVYMVYTYPSTNSNKYYEMVAPQSNTDKSFVCRYGRVTDNNQNNGRFYNGYITGRVTKWNICQWTAKYLEKRDKGYTDITKSYYGKEKAIKKQKEKPDTEIVDNEQNRLLTMLRNLSNDFVKTTYTISVSRVTEEMLNEGFIILNKMQECAEKQNLESFCAYLVKLYMQVPRALSNVRNEVPHSITEIKKFLEREKELLETLSGKVSVEKKIKKTEDIAKSLKVSARLVTEKEQKMIIDLMEKGRYSTSTSRFLRAWKVTNKNTEKAFNELLMSDDYKGVKPMLLWHGSRSENWFHIVGEGLSISHASSGMFSDYNSGLYFAPKFSKSEGYTSICGSHWRSGTENTAYLALFDVAMGKYKEVFERDNVVANMNYEKLHKMGFQSLWAKADKGMLANDECVVYQDNACTIRYIVEIGF